MSKIDLSDFDDFHRVQMLWADDPDYGGRVKLTATPELVAAYREWQSIECRHAAVGIVAIRASNGAPMYREQCVDCGFAVGQWISKSKVPDIDRVPIVASDLLAKHDETRLASWRGQQAIFARLQLANSDTEYAQYLRSDTWKQKRAKVLKRANGVCEGCGEEAATEVHHLTYRHIQQEFLWELVAVCEGCHERIHPDEES